jgi:ATP-dependent Clp protease ATP-binding subunit ClpA
MAKKNENIPDPNQEDNKKQNNQEIEQNDNLTPADDISKGEKTDNLSETEKINEVSKEKIKKPSKKKKKKDPFSDSKNIDTFFGNSLKEMDKKEISNNQDFSIEDFLPKNERKVGFSLTQQSLLNDIDIKEMENIPKKKGLTGHLSDLMTKWKDTFLGIFNLRKNNPVSDDYLLIEDNKDTIVDTEVDINKENPIKETETTDRLPLSYIKSHPKLKILYNSSIYKNFKDEKRPPEYYIRRIVQLVSVHTEKELLSKYFITVENFNLNDFIKYSTDLRYVTELINLRDQEQLLLPAPKATQIIEKQWRIKMKPNASIQEIHDKIRRERKRILKQEKVNDEKLEAPKNVIELANLKLYNPTQKEEEKKGLFSFSFENLFGSLIGKPDPKTTISALEKFGTNLTNLAKAGVLDPCFGRDKELSLLLEILLRRQKNNAILLGEAGVGKTAIIELLASKLVEDDVPFVLMGREIISLDLTRTIGGSRYRGDFEQRMQEIVDAVFDRPNIILFIDEIHNIHGAGSAEGSMDAGNILKPILSRSGFQCVGATTTKEYQRIEQDAALNRRFQAIKVEEPTVQETINILYGLRPTMEMYHNIEIATGAFHSATELSHRYILDRFLPDKALDLVDRAAARLVFRLTSKEYTSVISALINSILRKIGKIKTESFRRGDIASEFVFQEVENAYRNLLVTWLENYKNIALTRNEIEDRTTQSLTLSSPISKGLYTLMQKTILGRVDELLFTNQKPKLVTEKEFKQENLSKEHNFKIYKKIFRKNKFKLSLYRCSLVFFIEWLFTINLSKKKNISLNHEIFDEKQDSFDNLIGSYISIGGITHLQLLREMSLEDNLKKSLSNNFYKSISDFIKKDAEEYSEQLYDLNELENSRVEIFENFLVQLRPLVQQGLIESNVITGDLDVDPQDINRIYKLLGYFSTLKGKSFLQSFNEPELLKEARRYNNVNSLKNRIGEEEIQKLFSELTGIPIESLTEKDTKKLLTLEHDLKERVVGQEEAVSAITKAVLRSRMGIQNPNRPIASFLFCGPTGVGKTEVSKALAECLFGSPKDMIRLDMSEYMEKIAISRLIGSPPGYVGYDDGGQLTDAVRRRPYSVVLFDELEKAHSDILTILLQILEDGRLTDSKKRLIGFENTVIIMTSNAAASEIQLLLKDFETLQIKKDAQVEKKAEQKKEESKEEKTNHKYNEDYVGVIEFFHSSIKDDYFSDIHEELSKVYKKSFLNVKPYTLYENYLEDLDLKDATSEQKLQEEINLNQEEINQLETTLKNRVLETLSTLFLPEFLNRLDDIIIFQPLKPKDIRQICDILLKTLIARVKDRGFELVVEPSARGVLAIKGYNPKYGARPLRRLITKTVEDLVSEILLNSPNLSLNSKIIIETNEKQAFTCKTISVND